MWGKILGGMAGFAFGGPIGAVVGAFAGHAVDRMNSDFDPGERLAYGGASSGMSAASKQMAFSLAAIVLGAKLAKADGPVRRVEINAFKEVFRIPLEQQSAVGHIFDVAKQDAEGYEPYARQVATLFRDEPAVLEGLLSGLVYIARADGPLQPAEDAFLARVAHIFGFDARLFERMSGHRGSIQTSAVDPYRVLGVSPDATDEAIKKVYRQLIRENHPDALAARGDQSSLASATERMAIINAAYDEVCKQRGMR